MSAPDQQPAIMVVLTFIAGSVLLVLGDLLADLGC
jgi:hypothetical protein